MVRGREDTGQETMDRIKLWTVVRTSSSPVTDNLSPINEKNKHTKTFISKNSQTRSIPSRPPIIMVSIAAHYSKHLHFAYKKESSPLSQALQKVTYLPYSKTALTNTFPRYRCSHRQEPGFQRSQNPYQLPHRGIRRPAKELALELSLAYNIKAVPCRADISTQEGYDLIIATCKSSRLLNAKTEELQVDILVHSAAIFHTALLGAVTPEDFHRVYSTNVLGPILLTQACKPYLPTDRSGRIINISSVGSKVGLQYLALYGGTKGALEAMTRTWARELAENATVNSISVGSTMTEIFSKASDEVKAAIALFYSLTPLSPVREWDTEEAKELRAKYGGRVGYPEEVAGIVGMGCGPESSWMTGNLVSTSGGQWTSR